MKQLKTEKFHSWLLQMLQFPFVNMGLRTRRASNRTSSKEVFKASLSCAQSSSSFMAVSSVSVGIWFHLVPTSKNKNFGQQGKTDSLHAQARSS